MGRKRFKRIKRVRPVPLLSDRADLPPDVAEFMAIFDESGPGWKAVPSDGGTVWTILAPDGEAAMAFGSVSADEAGPNRNADASRMNLGALWADPEFHRQCDAGLVDVYGRPLHPEGRDFFAERHQGHAH